MKNECNAGDVAPLPQLAARPQTNVNSADAAVETRILVDENPPRKKVRRLRWTSTAPKVMMNNGVATKKSYPVLYDKYNWMDGALVIQLLFDKPWEALLLKRSSEI